jgi:hypothetical protein
VEGKTGATGVGRCATMRGGTEVPRGTRESRCVRGGDAALFMAAWVVDRRVEMISTPTSGGRCRTRRRREVVTADQLVKSAWG